MIKKNKGISISPINVLCNSDSGSNLKDLQTFRKFFQKQNNDFFACCSIYSPDVVAKNGNHISKEDLEIYCIGTELELAIKELLELFKKNTSLAFKNLKKAQKELEDFSSRVLENFDQHIAISGSMEITTLEESSELNKELNEMIMNKIKGIKGQIMTMVLFALGNLFEKNHDQASFEWVENVISECCDIVSEIEAEIGFDQDLGAIYKIPLNSMLQTLHITDSRDCKILSKLLTMENEGLVGETINITLLKLSKDFVKEKNIISFVTDNNPDPHFLVYSILVKNKVDVPMDILIRMLFAYKSNNEFFKALMIFEDKIKIKDLHDLKMDDTSIRLIHRIPFEALCRATNHSSLKLLNNPKLDNVKSYIEENKNYNFGDKDKLDYRFMLNLMLKVKDLFSVIEELQLDISEFNVAKSIFDKKFVA